MKSLTKGTLIGSAGLGAIALSVTLPILVLTILAGVSALLYMLVQLLWQIVEMLLTPLTMFS